jgi:hypothetical protein
MVEDGTFQVSLFYTRSSYHTRIVHSGAVDETTKQVKRFEKAKQKHYTGLSQRVHTLFRLQRLAERRDDLGRALTC